jgi:hypothetical protein
MPSDMPQGDLRKALMDLEGVRRGQGLPILSLDAEEDGSSPIRHRKAPPAVANASTDQSTASPAPAVTDDSELTEGMRSFDAAVDRGEQVHEHMWGHTTETRDFAYEKRASPPIAESFTFTQWDASSAALEEESAPSEDPNRNRTVPTLSIPRPPKRQREEDDAQTDDPNQPPVAESFRFTQWDARSAANDLNENTSENSASNRPVTTLAIPTPREQLQAPEDEQADDSNDLISPRSTMPEPMYVRSRPGQIPFRETLAAQRDTAGRAMASSSRAPPIDTPPEGLRQAYRERTGLVREDQPLDESYAAAVSRIRQQMVEDRQRPSSLRDSTNQTRAAVEEHLETMQIRRVLSSELEPPRPVRLS